MTDGPTEEDLKQFFEVARAAAQRASKDDQVVEEAAGHAVVQLQRYWGAVEDTEKKRRSWVSVVARNAARRLGAKLHKDVPFGRAGSLLPETDDPEADERAAELVADMHRGGGSLASDVVRRVAFEERWALLSDAHRDLLHAKYALDLKSKDIARRRGLGETEAQVNHRLAEARAVARLVLEDLLEAP